MEYEINGIAFYIESYDDGWGWWNAREEMIGYTTTPLGALQNAIDHMEKKIQDSNECDFEQLPQSQNADAWKEDR